MGSVLAKLTSTRLMNKTTSHGNRQSSSYNLLLALVFLRGVLLAVAASSLAFFLIYTLPSLKVLLFEAIPSLWRYCSCALFTPTNLFVMLNFIILSIFGMARLDSGGPAASASSSALVRLPGHDQGAQKVLKDVTVDRSLSGAFKVDYQKFADLQLAAGSEVESNAGEPIKDQSPSGHSIQKKDDRDKEAVDTGVMVLREMIEEAHDLHKAGDSGHSADLQIDKQKADPESKKTIKANICTFPKSAPAQTKKAATSISSCVQGNPLPASSHDHIDSLLAEESSIFTLAQSRPLRSARFTHNKAIKLSGLDRPLSARKMSRPIVKRGDTLDATWKAICESKRHSSPLDSSHSKHTKKVDPYEETSKEVTHTPRVSSPSSLSPIKQRSKIIMSSLRDKEQSKPNNPLIKREPSMPQEELNAKVESFILRFYEQIRIQREKLLLRESQSRIKVVSSHISQF